MLLHRKFETICYAAVEKQCTFQAHNFYLDFCHLTQIYRMNSAIPVLPQERKKCYIKTIGKKWDDYNYYL
jgi:hypothetical protein